MRTRYLRELQQLSLKGYDDYKTADEIRAAIAEIFKRDSAETAEKFLIKLNQRKDREQLNAE